MKLHPIGAAQLATSKGKAMTHDNVTDIVAKLDKLHANRAIDGLWCNVHPNDMLAIFAALKDLATLRKQLENAREALDFYAEPASYCKLYIPALPEKDPRTFAPVLQDGGERAREALKGPQ